MVRIARARDLRLLAALVALALLALPAAAGTSKYEDPDHGFLIKLPSRDWSQTPLQPDESIEVAKFKDDRQGDFSTLGIYKFAVQGGAAVTTPADGEAESPTVPQPIPQGPWGRRPQSAKEQLGTYVGQMHRQYRMEYEGLPEPDTKDFGDLEGDIYVIALENKQWSRKASIVAGIVDNGQDEYLILYSYPNKLKSRVETAFVRSIRSFRFPDADADDDDEEDEEDVEDRGRVIGDEDELLDLEKRAKIKEGLVGDWRFIDTPHYIIVYNCDDNLAKTIAKRIEYMRTHAFEVVFPPVKPIESCMVVRVCKEMDEYHHYGGPRGSAGYWYSAHDELVFPDLSRSKRPDEKTIGVLNHEGFHQYINYALLGNDPPVWFNEGFAEYFFCVNSTGKRLRFEKRHPMRYSIVKSALGSGNLIPIPDFIHLTHQQYMRRASLCYAQGWAFATWLKNVTRNERWQQIPEIFFQEMQRGYAAQEQRRWGRTDPIAEAALEKAFEGIDLEEMNEEFQKDLKKKM